MKKKLLWCMTALTALLSTSCTSELALEGASSPNNVLTGEEVEVTFAISAEGAQMQTRVGGPGKYQSKVGKGTEIDMLIYAVYEQDDDTKKYTLLKQYGKGIVGEDYTDDVHTPFAANSKAIAAKKSDGKTDNDDNDDDGYKEPPYAGQTILNVGNTFQKEDGVETITLRLMRNKTYHIAFWAQSSKTDAFKTNDLENVEVVYENAANNDELRDAFCKVESFSVSPSTQPRTVILKRPMAQINVGTTGADYKHIQKSEIVYPNGIVTMSKIELTGVSNKINVVTDKIGNAIPDVVTFDWSPLAAYIANNGEIPDEEELIKVEGEEFLRVDLNYDGTIYRYKTNYPTRDANGNFLTETFKYLSMCYALVPASSSADAADDDTNDDKGADDTTNGASDEEEDDDYKDYELKDPYTSSVLSSVNVYFAEDGHEDQITEPAMKLTLVPVHRNWRTNILGGLAYIKDTDPTNPDEPDDPGYPDDDDDDDPKDPDNPDPDPVTPPDPDPDDPGSGPDDPTSVFNIKTLWIKLDHMYHDEHNGTLGEESTDKEGNEWFELPEQTDQSNTPTEGEGSGEGTNEPVEE